MPPTKHTPGLLHVNNTAHTITGPECADWANGVEEEWCAGIRDESGDVVAQAFGPDADSAIALARQLALQPEMLEALQRAARFMHRCEGNGGSTEGQNTTLREECAAAFRIIERAKPQELSCPACEDIGDGLGPSHDGSSSCESGSIASGGPTAHCTCDVCF